MKAWVKVVIGAVVALVPPSLAYLQSRAELRAKYGQVSDEADQGYQALVRSVRELRTALSEQHEALVRLQRHVDVLELRAGIAPAFITRPSMGGHRWQSLPADLPAAAAAAAE